MRLGCGKGSLGKNLCRTLGTQGRGSGMYVASSLVNFSDAFPLERFLPKGHKPAIFRFIRSNPQSI